MAFDASKIKDPGYFAENRVKAHSDHICYASQDELACGVSSLRCSLNGPWKIHVAQNEQQVIPGFESAEYDCHPWADIPVPAHIQMEGYGVPQYCNVQYPWDGAEEVEIGQLPKNFNPVACYVRYFYLPDSMQGKRVFVSFQGAESCLALWLNGKYIGFSSDSFTPHEFELTGALVPGENKLACRVYRFSAGSWLESQDFMRFSGLFREVYLYAKPAVHLEDIRVTTDLSADFTESILNVRLNLEGEQEGTVKMVLCDGDEVVAEGSCTGLGEQTAEIPVHEPKLWSSEAPNLYDLILTVSDPAGQELEVTRIRVGFRRFEIVDGIMKLNGVRIVFKGVNRHDYCAESGRAVPADKLRRDLLTMKRNNINAVRTSHYPNQSALYALCDELGLYVIDENNLETHGVWERYQKGLITREDLLPGDREEWKEILLDRANSMVQRDKNHPCILIWSCGNESMGGKVILEISRLFHRLDSTRPVHYEGVTWDKRYPETTDIDSQMYTPVVKIREHLKEQTEKPFILCEYTHSMGNSNGAMDKYTEYAYEEMRYQGGFIWDFLDQSVRARNRYGETVFLYGGDHGEQPHDGNFSGNGIVYGDGAPSEKLQAVKYNYQNIVAEISRESMTVHNRSMFTNTDAFDCVLILERNGEKMFEKPFRTCVAPGKKERYALNLPQMNQPGEYALTASFRLREKTAYAPRGYEVAFGQGIWQVAGQRPEMPHEPLRIVRGVDNLGVHGNAFSVRFSYAEGRLVSYRWCGQEMLKAGPMPNFWRAPTDNDRGNAMAARYAQWKLASLYASHRPFEPGAPKMPEIRENGDGSVSIAFEYSFPTSPAAGCSVTYTVYPGGRTAVHLHYDPVSGMTPMPEFGMMLKMDADYDQVRYYGLGPAENYVDRTAGARLGIFETTAGANMARYLIPQECGNRTGVRFAEVTDYRGRGLRFTGEGMEFSVLPYTPHELENAMHADELPKVHYTVIRAAKKQMGVGGDDSWGARTHEEFLIPADTEPLDFTFCIEGLIR